MTQLNTTTAPAALAVANVDVTSLAATIVSAYVSNNTISAAEVPALLSSVAASLTGLNAPAVAEAEPVEPQAPAVPVKKSITSDFIICLEDGRKFKSLKRHLRTKYNMSPEEYRAKWGLPADYPMVAPNYAQARSELAKQMGLGNGGRQAAKNKTAANKAA